MATSVTRSQQNPADAAHAALAQGVGVRRAEAGDTPKAAGYGLPCAKCRLYYPAELSICPTCHHNQRVSPVPPKERPATSQQVADRVPDSAAVEQEREDFLRQFKSQLLEAHSEVVHTQESACVLQGHKAGDEGKAEICKACYELLQERLDACEAALHIDLKEAAQIIYDAVWADPSDPNKTYQNAASALLADLRKRAGINPLRAPFEPLAD